MLSSKDIQMIRRLYVLEHKSIRQISKITGFSREVIKKYLDNPNADLTIRPKQKRKSKLDVIPEKDLLNMYETAHGNTVVCARLIEEKYEIKVDPSTIYRFMLSRHPELVIKPKAEINTFEVEPGEQLQIDFVWLKVLFEGDLEPTDIPLFEATYSWSRKVYVRVCPDMTQASWLLSLSDCMLKLGIPKQVLCDNDVALVKHTPKREFTSAFKWLCDSLGVAMYACKPYHAQTKGRIERKGRYIKENALPGFQYEGIKDRNDLQQKFDLWIQKVADQQKLASGLTVGEAYKQECKLLMQPSPQQRETLKIKCGEVQVNECAQVDIYGQRIKVDYTLKDRRFFAYFKPDGKGVLCTFDGAHSYAISIPADAMRNHRFEDKFQGFTQTDLFDQSFDQPVSTEDPKQTKKNEPQTAYMQHLADITGE